MVKEQSTLMLSFERLSSRERTLVVSFALVFLVVIGGGIWYWVGSTLDRLAAANRYQAKMLHKIREGSASFQQYRDEELREQERIRRNRIRHIQDELNRFLRKHELEVSQWKNPKREPLVKKKKRSNRGTFRAQVELLERSFVLNRVKFKKLFKFLEAIERSKELLIITELKVTKDANLDDEARRVDITVATYRLASEGN